MFTRSINIESSIPYQVTMYYKHEDKEIAENMIESVNDVNDYYSVLNYMDYIVPSNDSFKGFASADNVTSSYRKLYDKGIKVFVNIIDDDMFNSLCKANGIDSSQYYTGGCKGILMNNYSHSSSGGKIFTNDIIGKSFYRELNDDDGNADEKVKITVCDTIDFNSKTPRAILTPQVLFQSLFPIQTIFQASAKTTPTMQFAQSALLRIITKMLPSSSTSFRNRPKRKCHFAQLTIWSIRSKL